MRRSSLVLGAFLGIAVLAGLTACGGSSRSPTDPASLPSVAGAWSGSWGLSNFGVRSTMNLTQDMTGRVTGTVAVLGFSTPIEGTVSATRFTWHQSGVGCSSFAGDLNLTLTAGAVTAMAGTATQDNRGCLANGTVTSGPMDMARP